MKCLRLVSFKQVYLLAFVQQKLIEWKAYTICMLLSNEAYYK